MLLVQILNPAYYCQLAGLSALCSGTAELYMQVFLYSNISDNRFSWLIVFDMFS